MSSRSLSVARGVARAEPPESAEGPGQGAAAPAGPAVLLRRLQGRAVGSGTNRASTTTPSPRLSSSSSSTWRRCSPACSPPSTSRSTSRVAWGAGSWQPRRGEWPSSPVTSSSRWSLLPGPGSRHGRRVGHRPGDPGRAPGHRGAGGSCAAPEHRHDSLWGRDSAAIPSRSRPARWSTSRSSWCCS